MYESLKKQSASFHLFIFAFDELCYNILIDLKLDGVTVISLSEFETPELIGVKKNRTVAEYCWTCTPSTIDYVLKNYDVPACTYIDSDLYFYSDPAILISELEESGKSVLITEHRYSTLPRLHGEKKAGRFCVQFITFLKEKDSLEVLEKWRAQCIDWCFARYEEGKFGDQKYLDEWPSLYSNIHILKHQGGGIAPWNLTQFTFNRENDSLLGTSRKDNTGFMVVFYHFQYVKFMSDGYCDIGWYFISSDAKKLFYEPYLKKIIDIELRIREVNGNFKSGLTSFKTDTFRNTIKTVFKKISGYNILKYK
jgi:hypothetical protein